MQRFIIVAALAAGVTGLSSPPALAHHFTIIGGLCFNPATNPPMGIPLTNPHCNVGGGPGGPGDPPKNNQPQTDRRGDTATERFIQWTGISCALIAGSVIAIDAGRKHNYPIPRDLTPNEAFDDSGLVCWITGLAGRFVLRYKDNRAVYLIMEKAHWMRDHTSWGRENQLMCNRGLEAMGCSSDNDWFAMMAAHAYCTGKVPAEFTQGLARIRAGVAPYNTYGGFTWPTCTLKQEILPLRAPVLEAPIGSNY